MTSANLWLDHDSRFLHVDRGTLVNDGVIFRKELLELRSPVFTVVFTVGKPAAADYHVVRSEKIRLAFVFIPVFSANGIEPGSFI